jgi:hypothetical protein
MPGSLENRILPHTHQLPIRRPPQTCNPSHNERHIREISKKSSCPEQLKKRLLEEVQGFRYLGNFRSVFGSGNND